VWHLPTTAEESNDPAAKGPDGGVAMSDRFSLHGSPHSLPTYRIAMMLRLRRTGFTFRYGSFQRGNLTPDFRAWSRWGQGAGAEA
jgi:hypothetical protein